MGELKSFDRVADVYDETRALPPAAEASIVKAIAGALPSPASRPRVLEVGIGTGRIAVPLSDLGFAITGTDISPKMLAVLRSKRRPIDAVLAESAHPPLRPGRFDAALFVHVLHLVPDPEATIRATMPLVRAGGLVIRGRDDTEAGVRNRADEAIRAIVRDAAGVEIPGWKPYEDSEAAADHLLTAAGATLQRQTVARWTGSITARRHLERLARRDFSSAWLIPDDALAAVVERARPVLEEIYGGMDVAREYPRSFSITFGRLPDARARSGN